MYTDGSLIAQQGVGAGFVIYRTDDQGRISNDNIEHQEIFHLEEYNTVFQAEVAAISQAAKYLVANMDDPPEGGIVVHSDSQCYSPALSSQLSLPSYIVITV